MQPARANLPSEDASPVNDRDFLCPICLHTIHEAFMTSCGHSFCYTCIAQHLNHKENCPTCSNAVTREQIFPNFVLDKLLEKAHSTTVAPSPSLVKQLQQNLLNESKLSVSDINSLLRTLTDKKRRLETDEKEVELEVLSDFLQRAKQQKLEAAAKLQAQIECLVEDISTVEQRRHEFNTRESQCVLLDNATAADDDLSMDGDARAPSAATVAATSNSSEPNGPADRVSTITAKKRRVLNHFEDLQSCYFRTRHRDDATSLTRFTESLNKFARYSQFNVVATLKYGDLFNASNIVSSIEFDRDDEYFATAGVTKKIKIFEFGNILHEPSEIHYPLREMACRSKVSCLSWNNYIKCQLASSDYEGVVTLWDTFTGQAIQQYDEHDKRVWSVDFSRTDPTRLVSGSDDTKVKVWSTNQEAAVCTVESKANICCVKFNPEKFTIAFGSADHHIHYYDLRRPSEPLVVFKGHRKAVSYVKFLNAEEFVSASTDSTLKLWNVNGGDAAVRTYHGHANEKNFVGLTADGDYIACGSESNAVFAYYKTLSKPILWYRFTTPNPLTGEENDDDGSQFVSSVCWRRNSNILLAANSQGTIKVMELT
eukprot:TRINITY_DN8495_c0_g1_i1.p1 TRINITY_DN8495_c0_g1~~TRINITY_DN8495_c0_g1_i1.p1  ORF type:complete len:597 (+),score=111.73 TRINITY_DN8495_c0_g1_i1:71-1861(+)